MAITWDRSQVMAARRGKGRGGGRGGVISGVFYLFRFSFHGFRFRIVLCELKGGIFIQPPIPLIQTNPIRSGPITSIKVPARLPACPSPSPKTQLSTERSLESRECTVSPEPTKASDVRCRVPSIHPEPKPPRAVDPSIVLFPSRRFNSHHPNPPFPFPFPFPPQPHSPPPPYTHSHQQPTRSQQQHAASP